MSDRCPGRYRHWRIAPRTVGMRTPVCIYCGSPNPRPLKEEEWLNLIDWAEQYPVGRQVREAVAAHLEEEGVNAKPADSHKFLGLVVCDRCGHKEAWEDRWTEMATHIAKHVQEESGA